MTQILYSYISEEHHPYLLKEIAPRFSNDFQKKILKYRRWQDAQLSLLGRVLLWSSLKKLNKDLCVEDVRYNSYKKPYFENENIKFNISHSGNLVVCVITKNNEVGVDVEVLQDINVEDFKVQMTPLEWQNIISSNNIKNAFFNYWTQKEAVIKAHGMGLSIPLNSFEVIENQTKIKEDSFFLTEINLDTNYKCHLASSDKIDISLIDIKKVDLSMSLS